MCVPQLSSMQRTLPHMVEPADAMPLSNPREDGVSEARGPGRKNRYNLIHKGKNTAKQRTTQTECLLTLPAFLA